MYNFKILSKSRESSEHLSYKISELSSSKVGVIDFENPWNSDFLKLTEEDWKELKEKGELVKTSVEKITIVMNKKAIL